MKDLEQLKQQVLKEVEEDFSHQLAVATKEEEERTNVMNATLAEQEVAKKTQLKQRAKQLWDKEKFYKKKEDYSIACLMKFTP